MSIEPHRPSAKPRARQARPLAEPTAAAEAAGLHYVVDTGPGIARRRHGKAFRYLNPDGKPVRAADVLRRIKALVIPPAWNAVWICPTPEGHLQATGRDGKGRKQYRYHPRWRAVRDESKYDRMMSFGAALPTIRAAIERDLALPGLSRRKVLAAVVRLLETTLIRVGNAEYAKANRSFGLTTMQDRHVAVAGATVRFQFRGKSGVRHAIDLHDRRLAAIVKRCRDLQGQELFQYLDDDGRRHDVGSADVNAYLAEVAGREFTAKDFRTWAGTVLASLALREFQSFDSAAQAKKNIVRAIESVAGKLGNTPSICRKCYVHPAVIDAYLEGAVIDTLQQRAERAMVDSLHDLRPEEAAVLTLLQQRLEREREHDQAQGSGGARPPRDGFDTPARTP